jgi:hypothetical protein
VAGPLTHLLGRQQHEASGVCCCQGAEALLEGRVSLAGPPCAKWYACLRAMPSPMRVEAAVGCTIIRLQPLHCPACTRRLPMQEGPGEGRGGIRHLKGGPQGQAAQHLVCSPLASCLLLWVAGATATDAADAAAADADAGAGAGCWCCWCCWCRRRWCGPLPK